MGTNKAKKVLAWIKIVTLAGMALSKHEGLTITSFVPTVDNKQIMGNYKDNGSFSLVYDDEAGKMELRDNKGLKVFSFAVTEEDLDNFPNAIYKSTYAMDHVLKDTRISIMGNRVLKETFFEETGEPDEFVEISDQDEFAFGYEIDKPEKLIDLVSTLTGGTGQIIKDYSQTNENENENKNASSLVRMMDCETGSYKTGTLREMLGEALTLFGLTDQQIKEILNEDKSEMQPSTEEVFFGDEANLETKVYSEESLDGLVKQPDGTLKVEDKRKFEKANPMTMLAFLQYKIDEYKSTSQMLFDDGIIENLEKQINNNQLTYEEVAELYSYVILRESGKGDRILRTKKRQINAEVKEFQDDEHRRTFRGKKISDLSSMELLEMIQEMSDKEMARADKELQLSEKGQEKYMKYAQQLYSSTKVTAKDQEHLVEYEYEMVTKHEDAMNAYLMESDRLDTKKRSLQYKLLFSEFDQAIKAKELVEINAQGFTQGAFTEEQIAQMQGLNQDVFAPSVMTRVHNEEEVETETVETTEDEEDADLKTYVKQSAASFITAEDFVASNTDELANTGDIPEIGDQQEVEDEDQYEDGRQMTISDYFDLEN